MNEIKKRIEEFSKYKGISVRQMEAVSLLKRGNLSNISENGTIGVDKASKIIDAFPDLSPDWLLTGKGNMLREQTEQTESSSTQIDVTPSQMLEEIKTLSVKIGHLEAENKMLREQVQNKRQYNPYPSVAEPELKYR